MRKEFSMSHTVANGQGENATPVVLVAEDNKVNRLVITSFLDDLDCKIVYAEDGQVAVDTFQDRSVDLILMDISMPNKDGIAATEEIRSLERRNKIPHTPIVAVTALDDAEHRRRCNMAGMDGFISKPLKSDNLKQITSLWLYGSITPATQSS